MISMSRSAVHLTEGETALSAPRGVAPWHAGYLLAQRLRMTVGDEEPRIDLGDLIREETREAAGVDPSLLAVATGDTQETWLVAPRSARGTSRRFLAARAIGATAYKRRTALTTSGTWIQQLSRAFAAEFLAPAEQIRERVRDSVATVGQAELEEIGVTFDVSPQVIAHQLANQLSIGVSL